MFKSIEVIEQLPTPVRVLPLLLFGTRAVVVVVATATVDGRKAQFLTSN